MATPQFNIPKRKGEPPGSGQVKPPHPPLLKENLPRPPDASDDSTETHASHGNEPRRVAPAPVAPDDSTKPQPDQGNAQRRDVVASGVDVLAPTPGPHESASKALERLCSSLRYGWAPFVAILMAGSLRFIVSRGDEKPYLMYVGSGNAQLIEIDRQSPAMTALLRQCMGAQRDGPTKRNEDECIDGLAAHAYVYGERIDTSYRVAPHPEGGIVIDIGDVSGTQVHIAQGCVRMVSTGSTIPFRRPKSMLPLAIPAGHGDVRRLNRYLPSDSVLALLLLAWITYTIALPKHDTSKYVILVVQGGEGSGKTSLCRTLLRLIDPSKNGVQTFPRNAQDLAVAAQASHAIAFDNIRTITQPLSDLLCMTSTGGTFTGRKLYTDDTQSILNLHVAVILNGIHPCIEQPDLAQRCLTVKLPSFSDADRLPDDVLNAHFEEDLPYIMRGLYDLTADILLHLPTVEVTMPTRMMGFSRWLAGLEKAHKIPPGPYQAVYHHLVSEAQLDAVMDNPVGEAVIALMAQERSGMWAGTPTDLLAELEEVVDRRVQRTRDWPNTPIALSKRLQGLQTALAAQGITVQYARGKTRTITIKASGGTK